MASKKKGASTKVAKAEKQEVVIVDEKAKNKLKFQKSFNKVKDISLNFAKESKEIAKKARKATSSAIEASKPAIKKAGEVTKTAIEASKPVIKKAGEKAIVIKDASIDLAIKGKNELVKALDQNGNGEIDIDDIIILGLKTPGVKINRADFLRKEFKKNYSETVVEKAISTTPALAKIKKKDIEKVCDEVIKSERNIVSGISAALGAPGGLAILATIPADIAQYYGCMLRVAQKMLYLYGFPELINDKNGESLDSETLNTFTLCLGVMYGVAGANTAIKSMAKALATGVEKKLVNMALTKGTIYPIVKETAKWFGKKMTKEAFAGFFKDAIPVVGGVIGGGITYLSFKPCCDKLRETLKDTKLSNPDKVDDEDIIDIDIKDKK